MACSTSLLMVVSIVFGFFDGSSWKVPVSGPSLPPVPLPENMTSLSLKVTLMPTPRTASPIDLPFTSKPTRIHVPWRSLASSGAGASSAAMTTPITTRATNRSRILIVTFPVMGNPVRPPALLAIIVRQRGQEKAERAFRAAGRLRHGGGQDHGVAARQVGAGQGGHPAAAVERQERLPPTRAR